MPRTVIAVRCNEDDHAHDTEFSIKLLKNKGVLDVIETFVRLGEERKGKLRRDFCMLVESDGDRSTVAKLIKSLRQDKSVRYALRAKEQEVPI
ncbi:MAG: hypothetical protein KGH58_01310 [Candidatus Micrarchaeota archaeon]|nr:hypothetical protein [Candidatus Micrarchaeota archaeon]